MNPEEREAMEAMRQALQSLTRAVELSERVGYGSLVLGALAEAQKSARYALDTAEGRT